MAGIILVAFLSRKSLFKPQACKMQMHCIQSSLHKSTHTSLAGECTRCTAGPAHPKVAARAPSTIAFVTISSIHAFISLTVYPETPAVTRPHLKVAPGASSTMARWVGGAGTCSSSRMRPTRLDTTEARRWPAWGEEAGLEVTECTYLHGSSQMVEVLEAKSRQRQPTSLHPTRSVKC